MALPDSPDGVATATHGDWSFVDVAGSVEVFSDAAFIPRLRRSVPMSVNALGSSVTHDGRYLLVADGRYGAYVLSVARLEDGAPHPVLGHLIGPRLTTSDGLALETASSLDGRYVFVSLESGRRVEIFDLQTSLADHFRQSGYVGSIRLGYAVVGMADLSNRRVALCHKRSGG